jgi:hypothetical protein
MLTQCEGNFGDRLFGVADNLFQVGCIGVALIDSDSPTVPADCYRELLDVLARDPRAAVLGPTDDGGERTQQSGFKAVGPDHGRFL